MHPAGELATFLRVVDLGSFVAAAAETGITASGLSRIVTRLENRLGVKLLHRTTRRLVLTQEGETYAARARDILSAIEAAEAEVTAERGRPHGLVRVNTGTAFAKHRLAALLPGFLAAYPEISVDLSVIDRRIDPIADQVDVTIRVGPLDASPLVAVRIGEVRRVIVASPAYLAKWGVPRRPSDLLAHNCLVMTGFSRLAQWPMFEDGRLVMVPVKGSVTCDSASLLLDLALAGTGIVRLGDFLGEEALADGRLVPLLADCHDEDPMPITALVLPGRQNIPRVRAFIDAMKAGIRRDGGSAGGGAPLTTTA
jgi:DNA-binding transcriptional LysR family regulator